MVQGKTFRDQSRENAEAKATERERETVKQPRGKLSEYEFARPTRPGRPDGESVSSEEIASFSVVKDEYDRSEELQSIRSIGSLPSSIHQ
jgi:hypothetical protein